LIVVHTTSRDFTLPKSVAIMAGLGVVVGLAVAAPGHAATPSTAASRIVGSHLHKKPDDPKHRTEGDARR
jgi:hypothetical protein